MRKSTFLVALIGSLLASKGSQALPLDPSNFASLGALPSGSFEIDTDSLTVGGQPGGVSLAQGGGAPDIAVFTFDHGSELANGETISVVGSNALAILFRGSGTIAGTIDVSGGDGLAAVQNDVAGVGGRGIAGGGRGGNGGPFNSDRDGVGPGHGLAGSSSASVSGAGSGSGGAFGTDGGRGGAGPTTRNGGVAYGTPLRDLLFAGSGGGGGGGQSNSRLGGGGGAGGGALEIGALTSLNFTGATILANGGNGSDGFTEGGAGSGGGILLHGFDISVDTASLIQASGGNGGTPPQAGGCGGAGRIEVLHHPSGSFLNLGTIEANAGTVNDDCIDGELVVAETTDVGIPEPTSCGLFILAIVLLAGSIRK